MLSFDPLPEYPAPAFPALDDREYDVVGLDDLLAGCSRVFDRYMHFPDPLTAEVTALWVAHTHFMQHFSTTPILAVTSQTYGSGKTVLLELVAGMSRRAILAGSCTPAALFRLPTDRIGKRIDQTLIIDEIDTVFDSRGGGNEQLRQMLNIGYRMGSSVLRVEGGETRAFPCFSPKIVAGVGDVPASIVDRSIAVRLEKRPKTVRKMEYDLHHVADLLQQINWQFQLSAIRDCRRIADCRPNLPDWLRDRDREVWRPLFAIADVAGGEWPELVKAAAAQALDARKTARPLEEVLIADLFATRTLWPTHGKMSSVDLIHMLKRHDPSRWKSGRSPLTARRLATLLREYYDISPCQLGRIDARSNVRGYRLADFHDAFLRVL